MVYAVEVTLFVYVHKKSNNRWWRKEDERATSGHPSCLESCQLADEIWMSLFWTIADEAEGAVIGRFSPNNFSFFIIPYWNYCDVEVWYFLVIFYCLLTLDFSYDSEGSVPWDNVVTNHVLVSLLPSNVTNYSLLLVQ